jgi:hypothetical protein
MTAPFDRNSYTCPRVAACYEDGVAELNVHHMCDSKTGQHHFVGFIGVGREEQIDQVIRLAHTMDAVVEPLDRSGFTDDLINTLMMAMVKVDDAPGVDVCLTGRVGGRVGLPCPRTTASCATRSNSPM